MDEHSLFQLDQSTIVIVPTGSLATHLNETIAVQQIERGINVWEAPNIVSWSELLRILWQTNREKISHTHAILGNQQTKMLWTQAIEKSKYSNNELTLLNVQQTVRACMRSDRLLSDWRCDESALTLDHVSDVDQFFEWREGYLATLSERQVSDEPSLQTKVVDLAVAGELTYPFKKFVWYAYDLLTAAHQAFNIAAENAGVEIVTGGPKSGKTNRTFRKYKTEKQELEAVFEASRRLLEQQSDQNIHIIVPDLQHRYTQVQELARKAFYPNASLTEIQSNHSVYRLSLGKPLHEWPAVESALCALNLLVGRIPSADLVFLFRSVYLGSVSAYRDEFKVLDQWLRAKRIRSISLEMLPALAADCRLETESVPTTDNLETQKLGFLGFVDQLIEFRVEIDCLLQAHKDKSGYKALSFVDWAKVFTEWLSLWGWQTYSVDAEHSSLAFQLKKRWDSVLDEYSSLGAVQRHIGMKSAATHFQQLVRDSVFLPQSAVSPIVVSGLLEALGKETQVCFLTGMAQDFPTPNKGDAFIPNHHLLPTGYPNASAQNSIAQARKVMNNLLRAADQAYISFSETSASNQETPNQPSPLFAKGFSQVEVIEPTSVPSRKSVLEPYQDVNGPAWDAKNRVRGGASIFKNQSQCAFKAFATHQLGFEVEDEPEFGLDHLDRGNLTHKMLELVWERLPDQAALCDLTDVQQAELLDSSFDKLIELSVDKLSGDKIRLLAFEKSRVVNLVNEWLELERKRPSNFSVVERESKSRAEWAGIQFEYIVDRVDITDSGQCVIVDYKTGAAARSDWFGERPNEPQLPLYTVVRDEAKSTKISGIAFGQIRRADTKFVDLADIDIFQPETKRSTTVEQEWRESRSRWPDILTRLAGEFLAGNADVNPVDKKACQFCELSSFCRVEELRQNSKTQLMDIEGDEL